MGKAVDTLQAGQERAYPLAGHYLTVVKSLQLLEIDLISRSGDVETHVLKSGTLHKKVFNSITVKNLGDADVTFTIVSGVGEVSVSKDEAVVTVDTSGGSIPISFDEDQLNLQVNQQTTGATNNGLTKVSLATGETKKLCDVNATRKYVKYNMLSSDDCEYIHIGGSGVDANTGYALERGMIAADETTGELWAHNPNAESTVVFVMEVSD